MLHFGCTFHREGLACSSLSVSEDRPIVPLQHAHDDRLSALFEYQLLLGALPICVIERELSQRTLAA